MKLASVIGLLVAAALVVGTAAAGTVPQTIVVTTAAPATATYNTAFTVAANAIPSGLAVTFSASGACTNVGNRFTMTSGTGTCSVRFDQAGDATYAAAPQVLESVSATKADQTVFFDPLGGAMYGDPDFPLGAFTSSGLAVTYSTSGGCVVNGTTVHITRGGSCTITASQPGDANFSAAAPVSQTFSIARTTQFITFVGPGDKVLGVHDFNVKARSSSGLAVSFRAKGACTITGSRVHLTHAGTCTLVASQRGNANYKAATSIVQSFDVSSASCSVPNVVGKTLPAAKLALARHHCGVGAVRYRRAASAERGRVVAQAPRAGRVVPGRTRIGLVLGRR